MAARTLPRRTPRGGGVLVTGAAGLIGSALVDHLSTGGTRVVAVDDGSAGTLPRLERLARSAGVSAQRTDVRDARALAALVAAERPAAVVHLAARHFVPACEREPDEAWSVNVRGTEVVADVVGAAAIPSFVLASTADVYASGLGTHGEGDAVAPRSVYGRSKAAAEEVVRRRLPSAGVTAVVVARLFNVYGCDPTVPHLIPEIVRQAAAGQTLRLGNLDSMRDYVFVQDAAAALVCLIGAPAGIVNVGTGVGTSGHDLVAYAAQALDRPLTVQLDPRRLRRWDRPSLVADATRLAALTGWRPRTGVADGVRMALAGATRARSGPAGS